MLLKGMPQLMSINHMAARRLCELLSELWEKFSRETILQFMPQLSSIAILALDYRRAFGDRSLEGDLVDDSAVRSVIVLALKFTEIELRGFLARLSEWRDLACESDDLHEGKSWKESSRSVVFFRLVAKLGEKLHSIFVPTYGIFWEDMKRVLVNFNDSAVIMKGSSNSNLSTKKSKKRKLENVDDGKTAMCHIAKDKVHEDLSLCTMVLECIKNCCMYDSVDFMDEARYESIMPDILSLLPLSEAFDSDEDYLNFVEENLTSCVTSLAISIGKDLSWKPMNHRVLLATRNEKRVVRIASLKVLHKLFVEVI
jgi:U3 small nucleolar RNA-associated protein 10